MRALEMTQPGDRDVLRMTDRPVPVPGPGQVLIRVDYAGLNFVDVLARRGAPGYVTAWPYVPGMEVAGTIEGPVGEGVTGLNPGDPVVAFTTEGGAFAEFAVADARLTAVVPAGVDLAAAATVPLSWATALGLARRSHADHGDAVLVTSAGGGVGTALAAILARQRVATLVGGVGSMAKQTSLAPGYLPALRDEAFFASATAAAGSAFDVILDSVGGVVLGEAAQHLAVGGRVVSYGAAAGQPDPEPPALAALRAGNQTVSGFSILRLARSAPERVRPLIADSLELLGDGLAVASPAIIEWDELIDAHVRQSEGRAVGKTVVAVRS
jgi:NADPH2:quinone reductase